MRPRLLLLLALAALAPAAHAAKPLDVRDLATFERVSSPALSPDGRTLAYVNRNGSEFKVTTLDLAGGTIRTLSDTVDDESPSFAPNGKLIIYATRAQGRDVLMTTTLDGRIRARLAPAGVDYREPIWGPFGR